MDDVSSLFVMKHKESIPISPTASANRIVTGKRFIIVDGEAVGANLSILHEFEIKEL
jgi:hypothetical protein